MNTVVKILQAIRPESDFAASRDFLDDGMIDSFDLMTLVYELDRHYKISIDGVDIIPENFRNLETVANLLRQYGVAP